MIRIKTEKEIELLRRAGEITRNTLLEVEKYIRPGVTTKELDKIAFDFIKKNDAKPSFLHYGGFPGTICASVNDVVVHGFPDDRPRPLYPFRICKRHYLQSSRLPGGIERCVFISSRSERRRGRMGF